jgi:hypothetical protein
MVDLKKLEDEVKEPQNTFSAPRIRKYTFPLKHFSQIAPKLIDRAKTGMKKCSSINFNTP